MADKKQDRDNPTHTNMPVQRRDDDQVNEDGSPVVAPAFDGWPNQETSKTSKKDKSDG